MNGPLFVTRRLVPSLRPIAPADALAVHQLLRDLAVASWLRSAGQSGPFSLAECEAIVARKVAHWTAHGFGTSLAWQDGHVLGWSLLGHCLVDGRSEVEIGWTVAHDDWGWGTGTELGVHALNAARSAGLQRVVAFTRRDNAASRRIMEKLAMLHESDIEHAGLPHVVYSIAP